MVFSVAIVLLEKSCVIVYKLFLVIYILIFIIALFRNFIVKIKHKNEYEVVVVVDASRVTEYIVLSHYNNKLVCASFDFNELSDKNILDLKTWKYTKEQWIELRYVGADGRMYRGRQTPDGKWVGDDGLVVDTGADLTKSLNIEAAEPDSWYKTQSGLWYYFENDRTTTKKGWFTDKRDNQTYYLDPQTVIMAVGWTTINGSQYYFNESHNNEVNWYEIGGGFYESYNKKVKAYGSMYKNETTPNGKKLMQMVG